MEYNDYLHLMGKFIANGRIENNNIYIGDEFKINKSDIPNIFDILSKLNGQFPDEIWQLGRVNCLSLLAGLSNDTYYITVKGEYDISRLALHAGLSAKITGFKAEFLLELADNITSNSTTSNSSDNIYTYTYKITNDNEPLVDNADFRLVHYFGDVGCIEVPESHIFYYRENKYSIPVWTGNSSRAGQKSICALLMKESDMPFTKDGIRPTIIFNPHGMPSRMTAGQLIESLLAKVCAIKGSHHDGTIFRNIDIESIADELEKYGFNRYGYERMISGITGEYIDSEIFFGPTYYQRLQHFVADKDYSVKHALTDAITHQPLEGMSSFGGLKIGEMEQSALASHGASRFLYEKFFKHSDGYTEYICRCGKPAIVNHKENIYKCKYCKDNADIIAVPTSWSSKLFMQEMESCNIGIRRVPRPFTYETNDTSDRKYSKIDAYDANSAKQLIEMIKNMVDDSTATVEMD
ncbi:MAG: hypothetical protein EBS86_14635 [Crocinitomicaceae bacterium]|nr:hypothetical protein [Crocinitomicaceae bacterium]